MPQRPRTWALAALLIGLVLAGAGGFWWWQGWQDREAFAAGAREEGWIEIGRFGDHWPARVRARRDGYETLAFQRADGSRHEYAGFHGYRLRVVFLVAIDGNETIIVQRAARKGRDADDLLPER